MNAVQLESVLSGVWQAVFLAFDGTPGVGDGDAHAIAGAAEDAARRVYLARVSLPSYGGRALEEIAKGV